MGAVVRVERRQEDAGSESGSSVWCRRAPTTSGRAGQHTSPTHPPTRPHHCHQNHASPGKACNCAALASGLLPSVIEYTARLALLLAVAATAKRLLALLPLSLLSLLPVGTSGCIRAKPGSAAEGWLDALLPLPAAAAVAAPPDDDVTQRSLTIRRPAAYSGACCCCCCGGGG